MLPGAILKNLLKAAQTLILGGCLHRKMGWPIWLDGHSYRVCMDCGIQRLFDEATLREYGPYSYQVHDLLVRPGKEVGKRQVA